MLVRRLFFSFAMLGSGVVLGILGQYLIEKAADRVPGVGPKDMSSSEVRILTLLMKTGYGPLENYDQSSVPEGPGFYDQVKRELRRSEKSSAWFRFRLIEELGKSDRSEDAAFLLHIAALSEYEWFCRLAREAANEIASRSVEKRVAPWNAEKPPDPD